MTPQELTRLSFDERFQRLEDKLDSLTDAVHEHINLHSGDKVAIAVLQSRMDEERHASDAKFQKAVMIASAIITCALTIIGSLITGFLVHLLHL